jgi:hypothetical protein
VLASCEPRIELQPVEDHVQVEQAVRKEMLADPGFPACPPDMALIEGLFCPEVEQQCLEYHPDYLADKRTSERCLKFAEPSKCVSARRILMRFCIDRYEWPNVKGALPRVLTDWHEASAFCDSVGKRLCDESEWLFSCEGEQMRPYVYGYERDPTQCVIDRLHVEHAGVLKHYDACLESPECRQQFAALDQREPSGSFPKCVSPFGVFDLNGNVNEWVNVPGETAPHRSGLKGGWWGPVRNRCRPTVHFHDENDWGYEVGFRCCRDAAP